WASSSADARARARPSLSARRPPTASARHSDLMTADRDPYATLGLPRTASLDEVKRAYRRLVKANHPDAAGEAALPRFLAIQDAYDRIVGPDAGNGRSSPRAART